MKSRKPMMVRRMLDAAQGRFRRARPGSVLIMVVSLLVLLALIGTAAMSTSRLDRTSSIQNVKNVRVDLLAEGVKQMVLAILTKDATAGNSVDGAALDPDTPYIPPSPTTPPNPPTIPPMPSLVDEANAILASLLPERQLKRDTNGQPKYLTPPGPVAGDAVFQSVSYPPVQTGVEQFSAGGVHLGPYKFDVPNEPSSDPVRYGLPVSKPAMVPGWVTAKDGAVYPGLLATLPDGSAMTQFLNKDGNASGVKSRLGQPFIAADTDGDGVADAMLVKLPVTPVNGLTYYAAVRVVDNAAKINLNTAGNPNAEIATVAGRDANGNATNVALSFAGIYPASVGLDNMFDPNTTDTTGESSLKEADKFNGQRVFGNRLAGPGAKPSLTPYQWTAPQQPGVQRTDFVFLTPGDSLHNQLGRRLDNPSFSIGPNSLYGNGVRPFGVADAMALAYRFTLINPVSSDSTVEKTLFMTVVNNKPGVNKPYPLTAKGIHDWFDENFDYQWLTNTPADQGGWSANKTWLLRSLLTSFNPVSNAVPKRNDHQGLYRMWSVAAPLGADPFWGGYKPVPASFPKGNDPTVAPSDTYVPPKIPNPYDNADTAFQQQPLQPATLRVPDPSLYPDKANVNTAQFEELWQRYFDVMCEDSTLGPFDGGAFDDIYAGSGFNHPAASVTLQNFASTILSQHRARMFRSPLRPEIPAPPLTSLAIPRMHPYQVMALRAAIAAANTIAMRTDYNPATSSMIDDRNIPFFDIVLPQVDPLNDHTTYNAASNRANLYAGVGATVYGVKRQPFITEVFLDNNTEQFPTAAPLVQPPPQNPDGTVPRNKSGFAAIEIHNPYDRPMRISGWKLGLVERRRPGMGDTTAGVDWWDAANKKQPPKLQPIDVPANGTVGTWTPDPAANNPPPAPFIFDGTAVIPAHGYLVVSNLPPIAAYNAANDDAAQYSPGDANINGLPAGAVSIYCEKLHWMIGRELVLLRPVERELFDNAKVSHWKWVVRWAPVDSFDASGIVHQKYNPNPPPPPPPPAPPPPPPTAEEWHYVRSNDAINGRAWHFVYPGRYEAIDGANSVGHHQGIERVTWDPTQNSNLGLSPWTAPVTNTQTPWLRTPTLLGAADRFNSRDNGRDYPALAGGPTNTVSTFPIQIANADFASHFLRTGPGAPTGPAVPLSSGFARVGDIMQVTYIGSYTIWDADANWVADLTGTWPNTAGAPAPWSHAGQLLPEVPPPNTPPPTPPTLPYLAGAGGRFIEMNAVTMDAAFAEDTDADDDFLNPPAGSPAPALPLEDVGRFAPITFDRGTFTNTLLADVNALKYENGYIVGQSPTNSFQPYGNPSWLQTYYPTGIWNGYECVIYNGDPTTQNVWKVQVGRVQTWDKNSNTITLDAGLQFPLSNNIVYKFKLERKRYGWASKLFDHFTTLNEPADDHLPNVDQSLWGTKVEDVKNISDPSRPVNRFGVPTEDDVPAEGLININTANWKTLAQLPLVMNPANPAFVHPAASEEMARRIVYFRDVDDGRGVDPNNLTPATLPPHPHGPFKSLHELTMVPGFMTAMGSIDTTNDLTKNPGAAMGDYSPMIVPSAGPATPSGDRVRWDFKEKYLMLTRISNLITTKSDSFTAYIQVQGWSDAGTLDAKLVAQKRLSFIIDRSKVTTSVKGTPTVYNVPVAE